MATRDLTASFKAAAVAAVLRPVVFTAFEFDPSTVRFWNGIGTITWDSNDYTGAGNLLRIEPAEETQDIEAKNAAFELAGVPSSVISTALTTEYQGRPARMWLGLLDSSGAIIADPARIFSGKMDVMTINDDAENPVVGMTAENDLVTLNRVRARRYTHEDQQLDYPGDLGLEFVTGLQDKPIIWGK